MCGGVGVIIIYFKNALSHWSKILIVCAPVAQIVFAVEISDFWWLFWLFLPIILFAVSAAAVVTPLIYNCLSYLIKKWVILPILRIYSVLNPAFLEFSFASMHVFELL